MKKYLIILALGLALAVTVFFKFDQTKDSSTPSVTTTVPHVQTRFSLAALLSVAEQQENKLICVRGYVLYDGSRVSIGSTRSEDGYQLSGIIIDVQKKELPPKLGYTCSTTNGNQLCASRNFTEVCGVFRITKPAANTQEITRYSLTD